MYWLDNNTGISTLPAPPAVISPTKKYFTNGAIGEPPSIPEDFWFNMVQEELLGVLTLAGIAPAKGDLGQLAKAIQSISFSAYPVGSPIPWPTAVPPSGFLAMTGQSFSATTYPKLALAYPSLVLPDMRAEFIRGYDAGRGVDPGRAMLSPQLDIIKMHNHTTYRGGETAGVGENFDAVLSWNRVGPRFPSDDGYQGTDAWGGTETRPRNIAYYYIVRAA